MREGNFMKIQSNKKVQVASTFLGLVLLGAFIANQQSLSRIQDEVKPGAREPASVSTSTLASLTRQSIDDEKRLAEQVAQPHRGIASIATAPNDFDTMRFQTLEGKYDFKMDKDNKVVTEISLPDSHTDRGAVIKDRREFLKNFATQFGADAAPDKLSAVLKDDQLIERYVFKSQNHDKERVIELTIGESNTLLHLKLDNGNTSRKLF
jgi:hypothetical protein